MPVSCSRAMNRSLPRKTNQPVSAGGLGDVLFRKVAAAEAERLRATARRTGDSAPPCDRSQHRTIRAPPGRGQRCRATRRSGRGPRSRNFATCRRISAAFFTLALLTAKWPYQKRVILSSSGKGVSIIRRSHQRAQWIGRLAAGRRRLELIVTLVELRRIGRCREQPIDRGRSARRPPLR